MTAYKPRAAPSCQLNLINCFPPTGLKNTDQVDKKLHQFNVLKELIQPWRFKGLKIFYIF